MQIDANSIEQVLSDSQRGILNPKGLRIFNDMIELRNKLDKAIQEAKQAAENIVKASEGK